MITFAFKVDPIHLYVHHELSAGGLEPILRQIATSLEKIAMDMPALTQALTDAGVAVAEVGNNLTEALGEIVQKIADLQAQIAAGAQTTPEVDAVLADLVTKLTAAQVTARSLADIVPNPTP